MKKVALISDGWKRLITYAWVDGIMRYIHDHHADICLYHYSCHGNWSTDELYNQGEYNIYTLPDLSGFDGIILDCINITDEVQLCKTIELLRASGVPVVSISCDIDGFYYAGIDNRRTICEMMDHLYNVHGCRRFVFAGGPKENYENCLRVEAYRKSLNKYYLSLEENPVWYGDYDFDTGVRYFSEYMMNRTDKSQVAFPDAFVCANDNIAAGLCYCAQNMGYNIPEDFRVTGFDNLDKAIYFQPQISTVSHKREFIGNRCMEIFDGIWSGKEVERSSFVASECIFTESCGCPNSGLLNYRQYIKNQILNGVDRLGKDELLIKLESDMAGCTTYEQVFGMIADYFMSLDCDGFSIVVDKRLYEGAEETEFCIEGYEHEQMTVVYCAEGKEILDIKDADELMRHLEETASGNSYMFTPIHFRERTIGYSIMKNGRFLYDNPYFYDVHNAIIKTMENLYRKFLLENANKRLKDIYNRDQLTGVYNRIAYSEMIEPEYYKYCKRGRRCALVFADADFFKEINDTYGHERGDEILKTIANILVAECPEDGFVYRFGGDEFIVFFPCNEVSEAGNFRDQVTKRLAEEKISVSMGVAVTNPEEEKAFDEYLREADMDMYRIKNGKKNAGKGSAV